MGNAREQALAALQVLVCVATTENHLHSDERAALAEVLAELRLGNGPQLKRLLGEPVDLVAALAKVQQQRLRLLTYEAALVMATGDGALKATEAALLERICGAFEIPKTEQATLGTLVASAHRNVPNRQALVSLTGDAILAWATALQLEPV